MVATAHGFAAGQQAEAGIHKDWDLVLVAVACTVAVVAVAAVVKRWPAVTRSSNGP